MLDGMCLSSHNAHIRYSNKDKFTNGGQSKIMFAKEITVTRE